MVFLLVSLVAVPALGQEAQEDPCALGPSLYKANRYTEARIAFLECLESKGDAMEVLLPLAVMAVKDGRLVEAQDFGLRAVALAPEDPEAYYWLGRAYLVSGRAGEARTQWEKGLSFSVNHMGLLEGLARLALVEGEIGQAYGLLTQLQRQGVDDGWLHRLLADISAAKGLWGQTLVHLEAAMARDGANATDLLSAAELAILADQKNRAVDFCQQAVALEPSGASYGGLGEAYFAIQKGDSAEIYLRLAVENDPNEPRHRFNLANILEVDGNFDEADEHFRTYLAMVPADPVGHFNFGVHLDKLGQTEEGLRHVQEAVRLDPGMLSAWVVLAQIHEDEGDFTSALEIVAQLEALDAWQSNDIDLWADRLRSQVAVVSEATAEGQIHLLHLVVATQDVLDMVMEEISREEDFYSLVMRFSTGPASSRGGDVGWVNPLEMNDAFQSGIKDLEINEISPPIESGGLYHLFKRIP
jgi:tetratricopeptide (TPR) repeat protein